MKKLKPHRWAGKTKGSYGWHVYICEACGKETHIGLDIDYEAPVCEGKTKIHPQKETK